MKMRKVFAAVFLIFLFGAVGAQASESVIIPDYECVINDSSVWYKDSIYPLISYRDITYFPMTYDYCRAMGLSSTWVEGKGLYIAYYISTRDLPVYETRQNKKTEKAVIAQYPIYINGKLIDNKNEKYPLLNFRDVTYFPMTYDYATQEFNWQTEWTPGKFAINTNAQVNCRIDVLKTDDAGADLLYTGYDVTLGNGEVIPWGAEYCKRLDYKTGALSDIAKTGEISDDKYTEAEITVDKETGAVSFNGAQIIPPQEFTGDKSEFLNYGFSANARKYTYGDISFLEVDESFYANKKDGSGMGNRRQYLYLLDGEKPVFIGNESNAIQAARLNGEIYVGVETYGQTVFKHYHTRKLLYRYTPGAAPAAVEFDDYKSIKLIGAANGKLYLKCEWAPENMLADMTGYHQISPANDGYFTYDGSTLAKIANYTWSDKDLLSPGGTVYALVNWKQEVRKIN